jgi:glutamine synthetase
MSVFSEEWRKCQRAHYQHVIREKDHVTKPTLTAVLHQVGFDDEELAQLEIAVTMRDVEHEPDLNILKKTTSPAVKEGKSTEETFTPHPLECQCPSCVHINLTPHDKDGQPIPQDPDEPR